MAKAKIKASYTLISYLYINCASVKSSCAHAPPPPTPANLRALAIFFSWMANSPGVGTLKLPNAPWWGRRKRVNASPPGLYISSPIHTAAVFIHCTIMPLSALNVWFFVSVGLPLRLLLFVMVLSDVNKLKHLIILLQTTLHDRWLLLKCLRTVR